MMKKNWKVILLFVLIIVLVLVYWNGTQESIRYQTRFEQMYEGN